MDLGIAGILVTIGVIVGLLAVLVAYLSNNERDETREKQGGGTKAGNSRHLDQGTVQRNQEVTEERASSEEIANKRQTDGEETEKLEGYWVLAGLAVVIAIGSVVAGASQEDLDLAGKAKAKKEVWQIIGCMGHVCEADDWLPMEKYRDRRSCRLKARQAARSNPGMRLKCVKR